MFTKFFRQTLYALSPSSLNGNTLSFERILEWLDLTLSHVQKSNPVCPWKYRPLCGSHSSFPGCLQGWKQSLKDICGSIRGSPNPGKPDAPHRRALNSSPSVAIPDWVLERLSESPSPCLHLVPLTSTAFASCLSTAVFRHRAQVYPFSRVLQLLPLWGLQSPICPP